MCAVIEQYDVAAELLDQDRLLNLLKKEDFREFLISKKAKRIVLDNYEYTSLPNTEGCFQRNGMWIVYSTDDRSSVVSEAEYQTADEAFCHLASNINLEYTPNKTIETLLPLRSRQDGSALDALVSRALIRLRTISNSLAGTRARVMIVDDIIFLQEEHRRLREYWYTTTFDTITVQLSDLSKQNESLESALKRFKRSCQRAGIQQEVRKREHYVSPSLRRQKSEVARKYKKRSY